MRLALLVVTLGLVALPAWAVTTFVVDQENLDDGPIVGGNSSINGGLGWSFTPTASYLGGLDLELGCCTMGPSTTIRLEVHEGSFVGPVIGTSERVVLDVETHSVIGNGIIDGTFFSFFPALSISPGTLYVVEIIHVAGETFSVAFAGTDTYPGGSAYVGGTTNGGDRIFRTGHYSPSAQLYWADTGLEEVGRSDFDGTNRETVATTNLSNGVTVDRANAFVYWIECCGSANSRIVRADADGGNELTIVTTSGFTERVLVDPANRYLFFSDSAFPGRIQRVDTNGLGLVALLGPDGTRQPIGLALDPIGGKLYWTEGVGGAVGIHRMNFDGSMQEAILTAAGGADITHPQGIAIDAADDRMYWTDLGRDEIRRANLDGTGVEVIADNLSHGLQNPMGIAVDPSAQKLYWSDTTRSAITQANLDGSGSVDIITTGLSFPRALDLVPAPEPGFLAGLSAGIALLLCLKHRESARRHKVNSRR